jgi:hypothetical protein
LKSAKASLFKGPHRNMILNIELGKEFSPNEIFDVSNSTTSIWTSNVFPKGSDRRCVSVVLT